MKKIFTLLLTLLLTVSANAKPLTPQQALQRLSGTSLSKKAKSIDSNTLKLTMTGETEKGEAAYYVFTGGSGTFFLSADDIAKPVLGYTDSSDFNVDNMPPALKWWLEMYASEIQASSGEVSLKGRSLNPKKVKANSNIQPHKAIAPMVKTVWNQGDPFNRYCPSIDGEKTVTGCVATSMAQVMNYYQWPQSSVAPISYQWNGQTLTSPAVSLDWDKMIDSYDGNYTSTQADAVARLMQVAGYSVSMDYNTSENGGSGARSIEIRNALVEKFGYDVATDYAFRDYFTYDEWKEMIYENLVKVGPVIYNGTGDYGGHSFVCDGFDGDDYFHFNWGWGGQSDGYFLLSALDPIDLGIGGGSGGFNYFQGAVLGAQRPQAGSVAPLPYIVCTTSLEGNVDGNYLQMIASNDGGFFNFGSVTGTFTIGACLKNIETGEDIYTVAGELEINPYSGLLSYWVEIPSDLSYGTYSVRSAFKVNSGGWEYARFEEGNVDSFNISVSSAGIEIVNGEEEPSVTLEGWESTTGFFSGKPFDFQLTVSSTYSFDVDIALDAYICVVEGNQAHIVEYLGTDTTTVGAYSRAVMRYSGILGGIDPGFYYLVFANGDYIVDAYEVEVKSGNEVEEGEISLERWDCPTGFVSGKDFYGYLTVSSTYSHAQDYSLDAYLSVRDEIYENQFIVVEDLGSNTITVPANSTATMDFAGTLSDMDPGSYFLIFCQDYNVVGGLLVEVKADGAVICESMTISPEVLVKGNESVVDVLVRNTYPTEKNLDLTLDLIVETETGYYLVKSYGTQTVTLQPEMETPLSFKTVIPEEIEEGRYYLWLESNEMIGESMYNDMLYIKEVIIDKVGPTSISAIEKDNEVRYYNLQGLEVGKDNLAPGLYIRRTGDKTEKILVK